MQPGKAKAKSKSFSWQSVHLKRPSVSSQLHSTPCGSYRSCNEETPSDYDEHGNGHRHASLSIPDGMSPKLYERSLTSTTRDLSSPSSLIEDRIPSEYSTPVKHSEHRHAARLGLPLSPTSKLVARPSEFCDLLEQAIWHLDRRSARQLDPLEWDALSRLNDLAGFGRCSSTSPDNLELQTQCSPKISSREPRITSPLRRRRRALDGSEAAKVLLKIAMDIFSNVETEDQLAMMLNAHLPSLMPIDECTLFRVDDDQLFDLNTSVKLELRGIVGHVAYTGKAFHTVCPESEEELFDPEVDTCNATAYFCVPIILKDAVHGVLRACRTEPNQPPFTEEEQALLQSAACIFGESLRYLGLAETMAFEVRKNSFMMELAGSLASVEIDCDRLVKMVLDYSCTLTNADRCALFLVDAKHQRLEAYFEGGTVVTMSTHQGIAGHVATTGEVVNIADAYNDERFNRKVDIQTGYHTESLLCLPILYEKEILAVAQLVNKLEPDGQTVTHFTARDVEVFQAFSGYAAVSLRNARLFRKAEMEQKKSISMLQLAHHLAAEALDEERLAKAVVDHAKELTGADLSSLFILSNDSSDLTLDVYGEDEHMLRIPLSDGIPGHVVKTGEAVNVPDASLDPRFNQSTGYSVKSVLAVPLKCNGTIVAVAQVVNKLNKFGQIVRFTSEDEDLLASFALYAGVSIHTARLFAASHAERKSYGLLVEQMVTLHRGVLERKPLVPIILQGAQALTHAQRCAFAVIDPGGQEFEVHTNGAQPFMHPVDGSVEAMVVASKQVLCIHDVAGDARLKHKNVDPAEKSMLLVPVLFHGKTIAVIKVANKQDSQRHNFQQDDVHLLSVFATSVAISFTMASQYATAKMVEDAAFGLVPSISEGQAMLHSTMQQAQALVGAEYASLFVVERREFRVLTLGDQTQKEEVRVKMSDTRIEGLVAMTKRPITISDTLKDVRFAGGLDLQSGQRIKSIICVPLISQGSGAVIAVLQLVNKPGGFTKHDESSMMEFANFAAICLDASLRHAAVVKSRQQNEAAIEVITKLVVSQPRDSSALMELLSQGAKTLLKCERAIAFAADKERHVLYTKSKQKSLGKHLETNLNLGLAAEVVKTGKSIIVKDAYSDKRFNRDIDHGHTSRTRSILAMPLQYKDEVIGVIQAINKTSGVPFSKDDVFLLASFVYIANHLLGNWRLKEFFVETTDEALQVISALLGREFPRPKQLGVRHIDPSLLDRCLMIVIPEKELCVAKSDSFNVLQYKNATADSIKCLSLIRLVVDFFSELGITETFGVEVEVLVRFVFRVRHMQNSANFFHTFLHTCDMAHTMFRMVQALQEQNGLSQLDCFVLLVAALVHHVDHIGLNSSFHFGCNKVMADLQCTVQPALSMSLHHCAVALQILSFPDSNVFRSLDDASSRKAHSMLIDLTLFTDRSCPGLATLLQSRISTSSDSSCSFIPKPILFNALMATAELSSVLKTFDIAQEWAFYRTEEFYCKGDLVKEWYDEDCVSDITGLAQSQVDFLETVAVPHMAMMTRLVPSLAPWLETLQTNRTLWEGLIGYEKEEVLVGPAPSKFCKPKR